MTGTAQIIRGNALDLPLADASVDLIVTSPPYFGLRSYQDDELCLRCIEAQYDGRDLRQVWPDYAAHAKAEHNKHHYPGQLGSEATPAEFVDALIAATRECVRVLKPSGSIWVNLGDKYSTGSSGDRNNGFNERSGNAPGKRAQERSQLRQAAVAGMRPKSLIGIPWRYAIRCIDELGLILRAEIIWSKPNGLPESVTDRVRRSHETWFHFSVSPRYFSAVDEIREEQASIGRRQGGPNGQTNFEEVDRGRVRNLSLDTLALNPLGKLPGSVWTVPTQPLKVPAHLGVDHFAAFPMEFPRRIIRGWSPSGICVECGEGRRPVAQRKPMEWRPGPKAGGYELDGTTRKVVSGTMLAPAETRIVGEGCACAETTAPTRPAVILDPFGGTGTTALVAKALGRHGISNDMSADYCRLAQWRTTDEGELARALEVEKPAPQVEGQWSLLDLIGEDAS